MNPKGVQISAALAIVAVVILAIFIGLVVRPRAVVPDPARYLPGNPVAFIGLQDLAQVKKLVQDSDWWHSLWSRLRLDKRFKAAWAALESWHGRRFSTTISSQLKWLEGLLGRRISIGFYSGLRGISFLAAVRPDTSTSPDEIAVRLGRLQVKPGQKPPPVKWLTHEGRQYGQMSLAGRPVYLFSPDRGTIYVSGRRRLIEAVMDRVKGKPGSRLVDDPLYRRVTAARNQYLRAFVRWDKLPARKRTREDFWHRVLDTIKSIRLVSNLVETVITVEFRAGTATDLLGAGLTGASLKSPSLLPRSPLLYYGTCGYRLAEVWKGLLAALDPAGHKTMMKFDRDVGRAFGAPGLAQLLDETGNEVAVAVLGLHPGPLPLPQVLVFVRMKDARAARSFMPRLVNALKAHSELGRLVFETQRFGGRTVHYMIVPSVGKVGVVALGSFIVAGNNLDLLRDVIEHRLSDARPVWRRALAVKHPSDLLFFDLAEILKLAPESLPYLAPPLLLPRKVLDRLPGAVKAGIDILSFFRGVTVWSRWEAKKSVLTVGLKLDLTDTEVSTYRAGDALFLWPFRSAGGGDKPVKPLAKPEPK
jgi:hypothetical protein